MSRNWTQRVAAVAVGVVVLVGCGGGGDSGSSAYKQPVQPAYKTLSIQAGNFYFEPDKATVHSGVVNLELVDVQGGHTLVFDHGKEPGFQLEVSGNGSKDAKKIDLEAGKYTFYCDILGHRAQGMEGTLTVTG